MSMSAQQMELFSRLQSIFMPHAHTQRDKVYKCNDKSPEEMENASARFVHYTTAEAALKIIRTKRFWLRNTTCMSDYREVEHGFGILAKLLDKNGFEKFSSVLDQAVKGAAADAINLFNRHWQTIRYNTYIASISEHDDTEDNHGRLSMWRAFGVNAPRVAIVLRIPWAGGAEDLNLTFSPVAYLTEDEVGATIASVMNNIVDNRQFLAGVERQTIVNFVFTMILSSVTCLKHEGFKEEREWRAIYSPTVRSSPLIESATEVIAGVPQVVYKVPLDVTVSTTLAGVDFSSMFDRLIIGPSPYPWAMYQSFTDALATAGVKDAGKRVVTSGIPIRS